MLPLLQVSSAVKGDIQNAVNAGKEVLIPERELQVNDWRGVGYVVSDPETGAAGYLISGGVAGGSGTQPSPPGGLERTIQVIGCLAQAHRIEQLVGALLWIYYMLRVFSKFPVFIQVVIAITIVLALLAILTQILQCIAETARRQGQKERRRNYLFAYVY